NSLGGVAEANGSGSKRDSFAGRPSATANASPNQPMVSSPSNQVGREYSPNNDTSPMEDMEPAVGTNGVQPGGYPQPSAEATMQMGQQAGAYNVAPVRVDEGPTRPFRKDDMGWQKKEPGESRLVSVVTVLILVATLLLLGFSIYLA